MPGLTASPSQRTKIYLAGGAVDAVPVVLPELRMGSLQLANVRMFAGLDGKYYVTHPEENSEKIPEANPENETPPRKGWIPMNPIPMTDRTANY